MKNFIHNFIYLIIPGFILAICFSFFSSKSNAEALPVYGLDSSAFQVLQGGSNQAINYYGMNDPSSYLLFGIGQQIYNDVDNYLYDNYGYDFEDMGWAMEDSWKDGSVSSALADNLAYNIGGFQSMGEAISNGFVVASTYGKSLLTGAKQYIMGKFDSVSEKITDVKDNIYTKVTDSYIDKLESASVDVISKNNIPNLSDDYDFYYGKNVVIKSSYNDVETKYIINFPYEVIIFTYSDLTNNGYRVGILYDSSNSINSGLSGVRVINNNTSTITRIGISSGSYQNINSNNKWYGGLLNVTGNGFTNTQVYSNHIMGGTIQGAVSFGNSVVDKPYIYNKSNFYDLSALLGLLKNTWVTSDDLKEINDKINDLTLGNIVIDGNNTPVIDTDSYSLSELSTLIQNLIDKNADLSNYFNSLEESDPLPDPEPLPDPYENTGTKVPDGLPGIFSPIIETIQVPFSVVSMFEPIFYIFTGGLSNLFSIWLLFPLFILVLLVIWALK